MSFCIKHHFKNISWSKLLEHLYFEDSHLVDETAEERMKILLFWEKHGLSACLDAFPVSERTLYSWKKIFVSSWCKISSLRKQSRAPKSTRKRIWDIRVLEKIIHIRDSYPNLWKDKIYPLLFQYCDLQDIQCPKASTIWRLISDMWWLRQEVSKRRPGSVHIRKQEVLRKPWWLTYGENIRYPWQVVSLDTVEIRGIWWEKRYIVTVIDIYSRFSHAVVTHSHTSKTAMSVLKTFESKFPFSVQSILTDNGSEFMKDFTLYLQEKHITHYHTYPRSPKMNAHSERFNRTLREGVLNKHRYMLSDLAFANKIVQEYLSFYNTKRVHCAFNNKLTPLQKLCLYDTINMSSFTAI